MKLPGLGMPKMRHVGYVGWPLMVVVLIVNAQGMTALLNGVDSSSLIVLMEPIKLMFSIDSLAVWGACDHAFHLHCILKWVNSQTPQANCPMCRREWQFK
ncbi:zinc finger protein [Macleaya cordata]|uniref:Anaphase-promoting complex subunit 11 n=1 Tax=Macleaya cordata TaxID=56857 RepID=A0A200R1N9_MACCD|nr:zinc finger protein [Macleaya cordata]